MFKLPSNILICTLELTFLINNDYTQVYTEIDTV